MSLKIVDTNKLMKALLRQIAYLRTGECEEIVENWISEFVTNNLQKKQYTKQQFEQSQVFGVIGEVAQMLTTMLGNIGLKLCALRVTEVELSKNSLVKNKNPLLTKEIDEGYILTNQQTAVLENQDDKTQKKWHGWEQFLDKK